MVVKYSTTAVNNTIKTNSIVLGNGTGDYGPPGSGFWAGITPPASGYTIYTVSEARPEPSIVVANNDTEAIYFAKSFGGTNIVTIQDTLLYLITGSTGTTIVNMEYPGIVANGLTMNLDAAFVPSYPRTGNRWYDLTGHISGSTGIPNICTFQTTGTTYNTVTNQSFIFDGIIGTLYANMDFSDEIRNNFSFGAWAMPDSGATIVLKAESTVIVAGTTGQRYLFYPYNSGLADRGGVGLAVGTNGAQVMEHSAGYMPCLLSYSTTISFSLFTHFMVVYTNKQPSLYINGSLVRTGLTSPRTFVSPMYIAAGGGYLPYGTFKGKISTVTVYNRSLSTAEVLQNFNAAKPQFGY